MAPRDGRIVQTEVCRWPLSDEQPGGSAPVDPQLEARVEAFDHAKNEGRGGFVASLDARLGLRDLRAFHLRPVQGDGHGTMRQGLVPGPPRPNPARRLLLLGGCALSDPTRWRR